MGGDVDSGAAKVVVWAGGRRDGETRTLLNREVEAVGREGRRGSLEGGWIDLEGRAIVIKVAPLGLGPSTGRSTVTAKGEGGSGKCEREACLSQLVLGGRCTPGTTHSKQLSLLLVLVVPVCDGTICLSLC